MGGTFAPLNIYDMPDCVYFQKYGQGNFKFTDNTVRRSKVAAQAVSTYNSIIDFRNNDIDTVFVGYGLADNSGSTLDMAHNHIGNVHGVGAIVILSGAYSFQPVIQSPATYTFIDNDISVVGEGDGIVAFDYENISQDFWPFYPPKKTVILRAHNNHIALDSGDEWGFWLEGIEQGHITNNQVSGSGSLAMIAGMWGPTRQTLFNGNDISQFNSSYGDLFKIVLAWGTENYVVTGVPPYQLRDYGTSNLVSNTHSPAKIGIPPAIQAMMKTKMECVKELRR